MGAAKKKTTKKRAKKTTATEVVSEDAGEVDVARALIDGIRGSVGDEDGHVQLLGSNDLALKIRGVISTQCPTIDHAIGRGGVPLARLTVVRGAEASGKTTLCLHLAAEVQRLGGVALYIDAEHKLDPDYAEAVGVDTKRLVISQPSCLEKAFQVIEQSIVQGQKIRERLGRQVPILVVFDSMNSIGTKEEVEGDFDSVKVAAPARVFSKALRLIIPKVAKADVALVFISQERTKIGVMYGDPNTMAGGRAPGFYASLILSVKRVGSEREGGERIANKVVVECVKNQIAPPFKKGEAIVRYGKGFDRLHSLLDLGLKLGVLEQSGAWINWGEKRIGQGFGKASKKLKDDPGLVKLLEKAIEKAAGR